MHEIKEELEVTLKTILNPSKVRAMNNLQPFYDKDANKIVEQAKTEKAVGDNLKSW